MDHIPQDRQIPGQLSLATDVDRSGTGPDSVSNDDLIPELLASLVLRRADLRVPDPQFPTTETPTHEQLSGREPLAADRGDQLAPHRPAGESSVGPLRWVRCPDDGWLHLLQPADVVAAATGDLAEALCGRVSCAAGLTLANGSSGAPCPSCLDGIPSDLDLRDTLVSVPVSGPPLVSAEVAARALQECFLANADRGDNAANDELVAELVCRIHALRVGREGGC